MDIVPQIVALHGKVTEYFKGDYIKALHWFTIRNPMLGDISPDDMIRAGNIDRLRKFIESTEYDRANHHQGGNREGHQ